MMETFGNTGLCSLEISRTSKGDYTYTLKTYFSAKGRSPEAAIGRADRLRLEVERKLGLREEKVAEETAENEFLDICLSVAKGYFFTLEGVTLEEKLANYRFAADQVEKKEAAMKKTAKKTADKVDGDASGGNGKTKGPAKSKT